MEVYIWSRSIWKNIIKGRGQLSSLADAFRYTKCKYATANKFDYYFQLNCLQHIVVNCSTDGCSFYPCVKGHREMDGMIVKDVIRGTCV